MSNYKAKKYELINGVVYYLDEKTGMWSWYDNGEVKHEMSRFHYSTGNAKVKAFNTAFLPGSVPMKRSDGTVFTNAKGTCSGCCEGCGGVDGQHYECYAMKALAYHHNLCVKAWGSNTWLFMNRTEEYFAQRRKAIMKSGVNVVRAQESGEYPSLELMRKDFADMAKYDNVDFYMYTKRFDWYNTLKNEYNSSLPKNIHVTVSQWHNMFKVNKDDAVFIYDDGTQPELDKIYHCKAVNIDGTMNKDWHCNAPCKRCVLAKKGTVTAVYAHGKTKWKRTKEIIHEYLLSHPDEKALDTDGRTWIGIDDVK